MLAQGGKPRDISEMKSIDSDHDERVSKEEYFTIMKNWMYGSGYRESKKLLSLSSNNPSLLSFWEREDSLTRQVDQYFAYADSNQDGKITV